MVSNNVNGTSKKSNGNNPQNGDVVLGDKNQ